MWVKNRMCICIKVPGDVTLLSWGPHSEDHSESLTRGQPHLTGPLRLCWSSPADGISSWDHNSEPLNWADLLKTSPNLQLECSSWKENPMSHSFSLTSHNFWGCHPNSFMCRALGDLAPHWSAPTAHSPAKHVSSLQTFPSGHTFSDCNFRCWYSVIF